MLTLTLIMADDNLYGPVLHVIWVCDIEAMSQTEPPIVTARRAESVGKPWPVMVSKVPVDKY
jgi:hypothetical protein